jgi:transposase InsO family protein
MLLFFPHGRICEVPVGEVFDSLRYVLWRWGFIRAFRFDNGRPFGDPTRQSLTPCALCLVAMGIEVVFNPPRTPTQNAKVERCQGTTSRWAHVEQCADLEQLRQRLDYAVLTQREGLGTRVCKGKTRAVYFPELFRNPRRYDPTDFDLSRVFQILAKGLWKRKVSATGQTTLFGKTYQFGHKHRIKEVLVKFDPNKLQWQFHDMEMKFIMALPADNLTRLNIQSLSYCQ